MKTTKSLTDVGLSDLNRRGGIIIHPDDEPVISKMLQDLTRKTQSGVAFLVLHPGSTVPVMVSLARNKHQTRGSVAFYDDFGEWYEGFKEQQDPVGSLIVAMSYIGHDEWLRGFPDKEANKKECPCCGQPINE